MGARTKTATPSSNPYAAAAVHGLDDGRKRAQRRQRRSRRRDRILTAVMAILAVAAVGSASWLGYTAYVEHNTNQRTETDRRFAEIERQRANETTDDIIDQLQESPAWNGPGNPTFGVGSDSGTP
jgi:type VI protein secretion system component VasK